MVAIFSHSLDMDQGGARGRWVATATAAVMRAVVDGESLANYQQVSFVKGESVPRPSSTDRPHFAKRERRAGLSTSGWFSLAKTLVKILLLFLLLGTGYSLKKEESHTEYLDRESPSAPLPSHSCIHDEILEQRRRSGVREYTVSPQLYGNEEKGDLDSSHARELLSISLPRTDLSGVDRRQPIRIFLNYDAVGHSPDRDCRAVGDVVKLGEPAPTASSGFVPACNPKADPPVYGDCWYNCTLEDISANDKRKRLHEALTETAAWFKRALSVEPVKGPLRLSGYSACGQDGGVQLPRQYVDEGVMDADLVLLVTTRPTTGNTLAWAVACERDQWGRAIAGHVNVAPRHLTAEAETLLSATLIHEVMHVLGFDPHAFAHFRDERKRRRSEVVKQGYDYDLGRTVTRVILPRVVMHSRQHYGAYTEGFTGLELEDGGGRGTAGSHWEKRLLMNEIMTGSVDTRSVVSAMTLALLEDSGWYVANFSVAEQLDWGRNQGIEFVRSKCSSWNGAYNCNSTHSSGCTYNREAEGYCPIVRYSGDLPEWAQYFTEANKGGQSSLADFCAYFVAYSDGSCTDTNSARSPDRMLGEMRGEDSRCMLSSLVRTGFVRGTLTQGNGCYQHRCQERSLQVAVDGIWKECPLDGGPVAFPGFNGDLICPPYHELCDELAPPLPGECPAACNWNGECINGQCHCFLGFSGSDCSDRNCPAGCSGNGLCTSSGVCDCEPGFTGVDCSTAGCDEQCSLHGGVCDNGVCEFRCSDYAGYTCQNSSGLIPSLALCGDVLVGEGQGQHCAPSEASILQQLEAAVVMPNYNRLIPNGRPFFNIFDNGYCSAAAKRLACWISIQRCDRDGDNRLRVCHSACESYNSACGARLDCSDRTLFSGEDDGEGTCTGDGAVREWWQVHFRTFLLIGLVLTSACFFGCALWHIYGGFQTYTAAMRSPQGAYLLLESQPRLPPTQATAAATRSRSSLTDMGSGGGAGVGVGGHNHNNSLRGFLEFWWYLVTCIELRPPACRNFFGDILSSRTLQRSSSSPRQSRGDIQFVVEHGSFGKNPAAAAGGPLNT